MSVNGKFDQIGVDDLLRLGDRFEVPSMRAVIDDVRTAVAQWSEFAAIAGIDSTTTSQIADELLAHQLHG